METDAKGRTANSGPAPIPPNRWIAGQSGNPSGRPGTKPLSDAYRWMLGLAAPAKLLKRLGFDPLPGKTITMAHLIALGQGVSAVKGKSEPAREIADRVEGKVPQAITGADGGPLLSGAAALAELLALSAVARERRLAGEPSPDDPIEAEVVP